MLTATRLGTDAPPGERGQFERRTGITPADVALLGAVPLFAGLPPADLRALLAESWVQGFSRGTLLFCQDEPAARFYIVLSGWVKLFRTTAEGGESVIAVLTRGDSFAEAAIFDRGVYPVAAAPVTDARLLVVPGEPFMRQVGVRGDFALKMLAAMSRHLRRLVAQVEQLTLKSSIERVAEFLLRLCPQQHGPALVHLPIDKALIAGRLGMQPETLSRSLAKLRELGIETKGGDIAIADVALLREASEGRWTPAGDRHPG